MSYTNTDKIIAFMTRMADNTGDFSVGSTIYEVKEWIAHNIEEDVAKVVRCRWCDAYTTEIAGRPISWRCRHERITYPNDFCSDGEPKEGAE